jgi:hypothetical protein
MKVSKQMLPEQVMTLHHQIIATIPQLEACRAKRNRLQHYLYLEFYFQLPTPLYFYRHAKPIMLNNSSVLVEEFQMGENGWRVRIELEKEINPDYTKETVV